MATERTRAKASEIDLSTAAMLSRFMLFRQLAFEQYWEEVEEAHRGILNGCEQEDQLAQRTGRAAFALRLFTEPKLQPAAIAEFKRLKPALTFEQVAEGLRAFDEVKGGRAGGRVSDRLRAVEFMSDMFSAQTATAAEGPSADPLLNAVLGVEDCLFGAEKRRPSRGDFRPFESDARKARQGAYLDLIESYDPQDFLVALLCLKVGAIVEERSKKAALAVSREDRSAMLIAESWVRLSRGRPRGVRSTEEWLSTATLNECFAIQAHLSVWEPTLTDKELKTSAGKWLRNHKRAVEQSREEYAEAKLQEQEEEAASRAKGAIPARRAPRKVPTAQEATEAAKAEAKALHKAVSSDELLTKVTRLLLCLDGTPGRPRKTPTKAESRRLALIHELENGIIPAAAEP